MSISGVGNQHLGVGRERGGDIAGLVVRAGASVSVIVCWCLVFVCSRGRDQYDMVV